MAGACREHYATGCSLRDAAHQAVIRAFAARERGALTARNVEGNTVIECLARLFPVALGSSSEAPGCVFSKNGPRMADSKLVEISQDLASEHRMKYGIWIRPVRVVRSTWKAST